MKRRIGFMTAVLMVVGFFAYPHIRSSVQHHYYTKATKAFGELRFDDAMVYYKQSMGADPKLNIKSLSMIGFLLKSSATTGSSSFSAVSDSVVTGEQVMPGSPRRTDYHTRSGEC